MNRNTNGVKYQMEQVTLKRISTDDLTERIISENTKIIDIRPVEAYNGWKLENEKRGGHIKSAKSLPFKWSKYIDWIEIVRSKNINPGDTLIIYGYDTNSITKSAEQFYKTGFNNVLVYNDFKNEWSEYDKYPMEKMERYTQLVSPKWLKGLPENGTTSNYDNNKFVICHAHYQNKKGYDEGHIPGAISVDTNSLENPETWNRRSPEELKITLENYGITHDTTVILYGRFSYPNNNDS